MPRRASAWICFAGRLARFRSFSPATLRPDQDGAVSEPSVEQALRPRWPEGGGAGLVVNYFTRDAETTFSRSPRLRFWPKTRVCWARLLCSPTRPIWSASGTIKKRVRRCLRNSRSPCAIPRHDHGICGTTGVQPRPETALRLPTASLARRRNWIVRSAVSWEAPGLPPGFLT